MSQAGADRKRREAKPSAWPLLVVAFAVLALIVWAAWPDPPVEGKEANLERFGVADDPFLGDPDAPVVVIAMESPWCTGCRGFHFNVQPALQATYFDPGSAVLYYVQSRWSNADPHVDGGIAQECAYTLGGNLAFWEVTHRIYSDPVLSQYGNPDYAQHLRDTAAATGADEDAMVSCFDGRDTFARVRADFRVVDDNGGQGTPRFWVFGLEGPAVMVGAGQLDAVIHETLREGRAP